MVDLFIHAVRYFAINSWAKEQPKDLVYTRLLDEVKSHGTSVAELKVYTDTNKCGHTKVITDLHVKHRGKSHQDHLEVNDDGGK